MDLCNESCFSVCPSALRGKNFGVGHSMQTVQPNLFYMLIGIIDFYHFILLSQTLTLPAGLLQTWYDARHD